MTIAIEICQDNFIYYKTWTKNLDVKTSKKPIERAKNQKIQCLEIIEKKKNIWLHNRNKNTRERWVITYYACLAVESSKIVLNIAKIK